MLHVLVLCSLAYASLLALSTILLSTQSRRFRNVVVACVHDAVCIVAPPLILKHRYIGGAPNLESEVALLSHSCGYFLADLGWFLLFKRQDANQIVHHLTCLLTTAACVYQGRGAFDLCAGLFLTHVPSPLAYAVFFVKQAGRDRIPLLDHAYTLVKVVFIGLVGAVYVGGQMVVSTETPLEQKLGVGSIVIVNAVWLSRHLRYQRQSHAGSIEEVQKQTPSDG
jgi:hypothetical protein